MRKSAGPGGVILSFSLSSPVVGNTMRIKGFFSGVMANSRSGFERLQRFGYETSTLTEGLMVDLIKARSTCFDPPKAFNIASAFSSISRSS